MKPERRSSIHNPVYQGIVEILREARENASISQLELAKRLGMSQSDISKIESCERRLDVLEILDILKVIMGGDDRKLAAVWRKVSAYYMKESGEF